jgi:phospholipid/cholesterol/gamma-HCH transport system substrate-binding protein
MSKAKMELLVGGFVLLGIAAILYLTIKLGAGSLFGADTYQLKVRFASASGLNAGASVHVAGVPVGRVEGIRVDPVDFNAIVTISVLKDLNLPTDSMASIKTSGLIGDKFILLSPGADDTNLAEGDLITLTESSVDLESLIGKMAFGSLEKEQEPDSEVVP